MVPVGTLEILKADLSTFHWLLNALASFPDKELSVAFAHLILLSCDKVDLIQGAKVPRNRGKVQNLVITIQDQLLRDVEQRLERIEVGVPAGSQISL